MDQLISHLTGVKNQAASVTMDWRTFGHSGRYYAVNQSDALGAAQRSPSSLERHFEEFLNNHEEGLKGRVERTFNQLNNVLRGCVIDETGLRLTVRDEVH